MAARRRGRDIAGWLVLDKPAGPSSSAMVNKLRWAFDARKAGHAGTLDPAATGVLAVAFGAATKTVPYIAEARKAYRFTVRFGQATDTDDAEGRIVGESPLRPSDAEIDAALPTFTGDILQVPPQYSAVKIGGDRAYARARRGEASEIPARPLHVERLVRCARPDRDRAVLELVCGKGGYVRAIARDLGRALGCLAHVEQLRRIWSGPFDLAQAVTLEEIERAGRGDLLDAFLQPVERGLSDLPELPCGAAAAARIWHGHPVEAPARALAQAPAVWASHAGRAVAIGRVRDGLFRPVRVFAPQS